MPLFKSWDKGFNKTRNTLFSRISDIFQPGIHLSDALFDELESILIESDVGVGTSMQLMDALRSARLDKGNEAVQIRTILKQRIQDMLQADPADGEVSCVKPRVTMVVGVNGTGKTTTLGKLAWQLKQQDRKVLIAGADTFRAAAGEQLEVWASRAQVDCIRQKPGADPASVAYDALDAASARHVDDLLIDTAGRLHNKVNLMEELKKIKRVLDKRMNGAPHSTLLVLDATTGQNGLRQAEAFTEAVNVTEVALTKLDGTARGGIILAIRQQLNIPVRWIGVGEGLEDLLPFDPAAFAAGMFGD